jgi:hypothetical protein
LGYTELEKQGKKEAQQGLALVGNKAGLRYKFKFRFKFRGSQQGSALTNKGTHTIDYKRKGST